MPIYEYKCGKCGKIIEITQKFSDVPLTKCPSCSGKLSKLISNCSFHLKGNGWYVTDYARRGSTEASSKKESSSAESSASTAKDGDSKFKSETKSDHKKTE